MKKKLILVLAGILLGAPTWSQNEKMKVKVLETGTASSIAGMTISGGSWFKKIPMVHPAFVIEHPKGTFLFDTGLGRTVQTQVQDMVWWARLATQFIQEESAADQLKKLKIKPERIFLSHVHYDHVSGLVDFPDTPVEILNQELQFTKINDASVAVFPTLFPEKTLWKVYELENKNYESYSQSRDIFGDGALVLVGMPGHTPGSVGLFINFSPTKRAFLVGDTVWSAEALQKGLPKFWLARHFADNKPDEVFLRIRELQTLQQKYPDLLIVPSHDAAAVEKFKKMMGQDH